MNDHRLRVLGVLLLGLLSVTACTTVEPIAPGERPSVETDEAGLWRQFDKVEDAVRSSGRVVVDPTLNGYVRDVICRLAPQHCADIRFHIVRVPHMNASMAPNGYMEIWTGFLLRAQNEAQLAYVLGHELGHYLQRHSLKRWRDYRGKSSALSVLRVITGLAGVGYVGDISQLLAIGTLFKFSRDQEREADDIGFELMVSAGYDPNEAAGIWQRLSAEREAADEPDSLIFFATHPDTSERIATLNQRASTARVKGRNYVVNADQYFQVVQTYRAQWLRDELRLRQPQRSEVLLKNLLATGEKSPDVYYALGEVYRIRNDDGDIEKAIAQYRLAQLSDSPPPELYRSLGLCYQNSQRYSQARDAFRRYLELKPNASDKQMVESMLDAGS